MELKSLWWSPLVASYPTIRDKHKQQQQQHWQCTPKQQQQWQCTSKQQHRQCTSKQQHWQCTSKQQHWQCTSKQQHWQCTSKQQHWQCTSKQQHWQCTSKQQHWQCTSKVYVMSTFYNGNSYLSLHCLRTQLTLRAVVYLLLPPSHGNNKMWR